jgi:hypothetical protein
MTIAYSNGVAVFGSTDLDSLASSTTLVAGWESGVITLSSADTHMLSGRFKANNTAPTAGLLEVWVIPAWDIAGTPTYPDVFDGTSSAETVTYRNVLLQSGRLAYSFNTDATANRIYEFAGVDVGALFATMLKKYTVFVTHSMVQALNATASSGGQCWYEPVTF